jgi:hypothetical protein
VCEKDAYKTRRAWELHIYLKQKLRHPDSLYADAHLVKHLDVDGLVAAVARKHGRIVPLSQALSMANCACDMLYINSTGLSLRL